MLLKATSDAKNVKICIFFPCAHHYLVSVKLANMLQNYVNSSLPIISNNV